MRIESTLHLAKNELSGCGCNRSKLALRQIACIAHHLLLHICVVFLYNEYVNKLHAQNSQMYKSNNDRGFSSIIVVGLVVLVGVGGFLCYNFRPLNKFLDKNQNKQNDNIEGYGTYLNVRHDFMFSYKDELAIIVPDQTANLEDSEELYIRYATDNAPTETGVILKVTELTPQSENLNESVDVICQIEYLSECNIKKEDMVAVQKGWGTVYKVAEGSVKTAMGDVRYIGILPNEDAILTVTTNGDEYEMLATRIINAMQELDDDIALQRVTP